MFYDVPARPGPEQLLTEAEEIYPRASIDLYQQHKLLSGQLAEVQPLQGATKLDESID